MKPEMAVRRLVHGLGFRYRLHETDLPGCPDLVFRSRKKVIFVHGCYWHQHTACVRAHLPQSNLSYWMSKLRRTSQRDRRSLRVLREMGWESMVIWECELKMLERVRERIMQFLACDQGHP
jgi:DNA mismatch endonuclease, patch repair protein